MGQLSSLHASVESQLKGFPLVALISEQRSFKVFKAELMHFSFVWLTRRYWFEFEKLLIGHSSQC